MIVNDKEIFRLFDELPSRLFPWHEVWLHPHLVSPDTTVRRINKHKDVERKILSESDKERRLRVGRYRRCVPAEFVNLNLYCLAFYSYRSHLLFSELFPLLEQYTYFEWMMHHDANAPWYRDHLIHQIRVGTLGHQLLTPNKRTRNLTRVKETLQKIVEGHYPTGYDCAGAPSIHHLAQTLGIEKDDVDDSIVWWAWWMASLFHDIGYVFSFLASLAKLAGEVHSFPVPNLLDGLQNTFKAQSAEVLFHFLRTEAEAFRQWLKKHPPAPDGTDARRPDPKRIPASGMGPAFLIQLCGKGHSASGALNLLYVVERLTERGEVQPKFRFAAGLAALAILRHDTDAWRIDDPAKDCKLLSRCTADFDLPTDWLVTRPIKFEDDPISFLLTLCDQMQEWGRFKSEPVASKGNGFGQVEISWDFDSIDMKFESDELRVTPILKKGKTNEPSTLKHYREEKTNYFGADSKGGWLVPDGFCNKIVFEDPKAS